MSVSTDFKLDGRNSGANADRPLKWSVDGESTCRSRALNVDEGGGAPGVDDVGGVAADEDAVGSLQSCQVVVAVLGLG